MKLGYTKKVNQIVGISFLIVPLLMICTIVAPGIFAHFWLLAALFIVHDVLFIFGCCLYAKGKGYHPAFGLLGLLHLPGLIILVLFPDKHRGEDKNTGCLSLFLISMGVFVLVVVAMLLGLGKMINTKVENSKGKIRESLIALSVTILDSFR